MPRAASARAVARPIPSVDPVTRTTRGSLMWRRTYRDCYRRGVLPLRGVPGYAFALMALSVGIVGLPNVGKSTVFNALTAGKAEVANYPFCTIDPNVGVVPVPDPRLKRIESHIKTQKVIPAIVEIVDIAGLVKGASQGEGLGN